VISQKAAAKQARKGRSSERGGEQASAMKRRHRSQEVSRKSRDERRFVQLERSHLRLQHLYQISKVLTQFRNAEQTLPDVVALIDTALSLRSVVFILESAAGPHVVSWQAPGEGARRLVMAQEHAQASYRYLVQSNVDVRRDSSPPLALPLQAAKNPEAESMANFVLLPLAVNHAPIFGALQVESADRLDEADLAFLSAVVNQLAVAIDRQAVVDARQKGAESRECQQRMLAEATAVLSASIDYRETIASVARLMVPSLADACIVDEVTDNGYVRRLEVAFAERDWHGQSARTTALPPTSAWSRILKDVLASGRAHVIQAGSADLADDDVIRSVATKSWLVMPLWERGRRPGGLVLIAAWSRDDSVEELALAENLAARAALAVENARLYRDVRRAVRQREDLLAIVSHDLANPLNAIGFSLHNLDFPETEDRRRSRTHLAIIRRSASRMTRLIGDLLDAASIEAGHLSIQPTRLSVERLVSEACDNGHALAASKSVQLKTELLHPLPPLLADPGRLQQVLANLVGNAIKFTPEGGTVTIAAKQTDETVIFSVSDTGTGIEESLIPHLFERFSQDKRTAELGTGLGLFIVKGIVEAHQGRVWVESKIGKGSTFSFALPEASRTEPQPDRICC
jgi:signal transduction histidine kinase